MLCESSRLGENGGVREEGRRGGGKREEGRRDGEDGRQEGKQWREARRKERGLVGREGYTFQDNSHPGERR